VTEIPRVLESPAALAAMDFARRTEPESIFNHSVRSFIFAELLAQHDGIRPGPDYDREAVFFGCVLHDLGAGSDGVGKTRFEVEGADLAARFLTDRGCTADTVDSMWESIALHTSGGIAERRGPVCYLVRGGVIMDFGRKTDFLDGQTGAAIHARYPRLCMERVLVDAVVEHAQKSPEASPPFSMSGELLRDRRNGELTSLERGAQTSRWGAPRRWRGIPGRGGGSRVE
jgi:HD domain